MCGIAGIVGSYRSEVADSAIGAMTAAQHHRGPDDGGTAVLDTASGSVGLGARRLAIIDLSPAGHQPMQDNVNGNVLAYNGEIYNFLELRDELNALGHKFEGRSDTEVLLVGYREWGREILDKLRGMFGFALWDAKAKRLLVARDHLGIKPLYYSFTPDGFACASELKALLAGGLVNTSMDRRALAGFLAYGSVQEPLTIFEQVRALEAGSWMEVDATGRQVATDSYWHFPAPSSDASERELVEEGRALLQRSVDRHLLSDVPLGVFLSSGLDSTAVAGLAQRASEQDVHAFTVSFPGMGPLDEKVAAAESARRLGLVFHDVPVDESTALSWIDSGLDAMDQPSMDGLNTYIVSRAVRQAGLTVALSGQGGDEMFGGYKSFRRVPQLSQLARVTRFVPEAVRTSAARAMTSSLGSVRSLKARDVASATGLEDIYLMFRRGLSEVDLRDSGFVADELNLTRNFLDQSVEDRSVVPGDPVASVARCETHHYLRNTLLRDGDVFGMANSLEIRVPFLDRDVVDWALGIPGRQLLPRGAQPKHLLRQIAADMFGPDQLIRAKQGFALPLGSWMKGPLKELKNDSLATVRDSGLVSASAIQAIEGRYVDDPYRSGWTRVWTLVALGRWLDRTTATIQR